jgi:hypothetical protein
MRPILVFGRAVVIAALLVSNAGLDVLAPAGTGPNTANR